MSGSQQTTVTSPMVGKVAAVKVKPGQEVKENDVVVVLEAMKMKINVVTPAAGVVKEVAVSPGQSVEAETVLVVIE